MPHATNDGLRIYYEREGSGPPLILLSGLTESLDSWRDFGYVDALRDAYDLILIDPRGHGKSDKPHDPAAYAFEQRVADLTAVLDDAGIDRAIFWGYSMGGHIGFASLRYAPDRFRAVIVGGMHPYARDAQQAHEQAARFRGEGMVGFVATAERLNGVLPARMRARMLANDPEALAASSVAAGDAPSFADDLANSSVPMLIYVGDRDQPYHDLAAQAVTGLARIAFMTLPGLSHRDAMIRRDLIVPQVRAFLTGLDGTSAPADR